MTTPSARSVAIGGHTVEVDQTAAEDFWQLVDRGLWEPETLSAIAALVVPGSTFVDIGAWIGPTTLLAAACGANVSAFEPDPVALNRFHSNLRLNAELALRVDVHEVGLAPKSGTATVSADVLGESMTSLVRRRGDTATVPLVGVKQAADRGWLDGDVMKIDVEGAEYRLVPAMRGFLRRRRPTLLLSTHVYHVAERIPTWAKRRVRGILLRVCVLPNVLLMRSLAVYRYWYVARDRRWVRISRLKAAVTLASPHGNEYLLSMAALDSML